MHQHLDCLSATLSFIFQALLCLQYSKACNRIVLYVSNTAPTCVPGTVYLDYNSIVICSFVFYI